jgi:hypothetical protein
LPYADSIEDAIGGFAPDGGKTLEVIDESRELNKLPPEKRNALTELLARDPRPQYHDDNERVYGMEYGDYEIKFRVDGKELFISCIEKQTKKR